MAVNRNSERIPRSKLRGMRSNQKMANFLTVEDSLRLAAGSFSFVHVLHERYMALLAHLARRRRAVAGRHFLQMSH